MTLSFSQTINGKPNYFIEKIYKAIEEQFNPSLIQSYFVQYLKGYNFDQKEYSNYINFVSSLNPKLHTIREDAHTRWKPGNLIHPVINNRTSNRFQFSPVIKCVSVQTIQFDYLDGCLPYDITPFVYIDNKLQTEDSVKQLAINDGFDSIEDFFAYFNKDFTGKIIHWTDLKY